MSAVAPPTKLLPNDESCDPASLGTAAHRLLPTHRAPGERMARLAPLGRGSDTEAGGRYLSLISDTIQTFEGSLDVTRPASLPARST